MNINHNKFQQADTGLRQAARGSPIQQHGIFQKININHDPSEISDSESMKSSNEERADEKGRHADYVQAYFFGDISKSTVIESGNSTELQSSKVPDKSPGESGLFGFSMS